MKFLEYPELEVLSRALTFEMGECKVFTRIEAYSCKAVNKEKRLFKSLESSYLLSASSSPPAYLDETLASPFGRLDQPSARKTLFLLIATLNGAFPDHDFSEVNPSDFVRETSATSVLNSLTGTLLSLRSGGGSSASLGSALEDSPLLGSLARSPIAADARPTHTGPNHSAAGRPAHASLPAAIDEIIHINDCEAYTFHPDMDSDPHASAEPDEEGGEVDVGDPYDEGYDASRDPTPGGDMDVDAPVFDEDMPDDETRNEHSSPQLTIDEDDLGGAGAGLLWSTFAFFYNRRMKRILFVSVWSRKNTPPGQSPALWSSPSMAPTRPRDADVPALSIAGALYSQLDVERPGEHRLTPTTSPAKRTRTRRPRDAPYPSGVQRHRTSRGRSNSPAPSALSPFPHARAAAAGGTAGPGVRTRAMHAALAHAAPHRYTSADGVPASIEGTLSSSAPAPGSAHAIAGLHALQQTAQRGR